MMVRIGYLLCCSIFSSVVSADTVSRYLNDSFDDYAGRTPDASLSRMSGPNRWFEDAELRLERDDSDGGKDTYQLRLEPKAFGQTAAEQRLLNSRDALRQINARQGLGDHLEGRYIKVVELLEMKVHLDYLQRRLQLAESELRFHRSQAASESFQPDQLQTVTLQHERLKNQLEMERSFFQRRCQAAKISPDDLEIERFATPSQIDDLIDKGKSNQGAPPSLAASRMELRILEESRQMDRRKRGVNLDLIQFKQERNENETNSSIGVGIRIPLGDSDFSDLQQAYRISGLRAKIEIDLLELKGRLEDLENTVGRLEIDYQLGVTELADVDRRLGKMKNTQLAELILSLRGKRIEALKQRDDTRLSLLKSAVHYLHTTGLIAGEPRRNWLAYGFPDL